jgi:uncharacterized protein (DUF1919 family)
VYQYFGLKYSSPFVGLFLFSEDYLKLLKNFDAYINAELLFINPEDTKYKNELINGETYGKYPIGILNISGGGVEIHFLHYHTNKEAREKWNRRKARINYDNLIIKYCDRDLATFNEIKEFSELSFKRKIILTARKYPFGCCVKLKNENGEYVNKEWRNFLKTVNLIKLLNSSNWDNGLV